MVWQGAVQCVFYHTVFFFFSLNCHIMTFHSCLCESYVRRGAIQCAAEKLRNSIFFPHCTALDQCSGVNGTHRNQLFSLCPCGNWHLSSVENGSHHTLCKLALMVRYLNHKYFSKATTYRLLYYFRLKLL